MIERYSPTPYYVQVANEIAARIKRGQYKPGFPIPSELQLQQEFDISRGTARSAVRELRRRELVATVPHRGTYVLPLPAE